MNYYKQSNGERIKKKDIDKKVKWAKAVKLRQFYNEHLYYYCEDCMTNQGYIDCSHDISVDECQKSGRSELAWDVENIVLRCRSCHRKHDKS